MELVQFIKNLGKETCLGVELSSDAGFSKKLFNYFKENNKKIYNIDIAELNSYETAIKFIKLVKENYPEPEETIIILKESMNISNNENSKLFTQVIYMELCDLGYKMLMDSNIIKKQTQPLKNRVFKLEKQTLLTMLESNIQNNINIIRKKPTNKK